MFFIYSDKIKFKYLLVSNKQFFQTIFIRIEPWHSGKISEWCEVDFSSMFEMVWGNSLYLPVINNTIIYIVLKL